MRDHEILDIDDLTIEDLRRQQQYIPEDLDHTISSLTRQTLEQEREPSKQAKKVVDFARTFIGSESAYSINGGYQESNPLLEEPPYKMNNASFVYWCYNNEFISLRGGNLAHTIQTIKNDFNFQTVGRIGSSKTHEVLSLGDIVFFNNDRHIGIYSGEGKFISFLGNKENDFSGGVKENDMTQGKWLKYYQGHAIRHKGGTGV